AVPATSVPTSGLPDLEDQALVPVHVVAIARMRRLPPAGGPHRFGVLADRAEQLGKIWLVVELAVEIGMIEVGPGSDLGHPGPVVGDLAVVHRPQVGDQAAARTEDPGELGQRAGGLAEMAEQVPAEDAVDRAV